MNTIETRINVHFPGFSLAVELTLPATGIIGLFGESGSGKSTFLRTIAGLERPVNSRIVISGNTWHDDDRGIFIPTHKRSLGFVFQDGALFPHMSVLANMQYGLKRIPAEKRKIPLTHVAELLGITHLLDRKPDSLSGGEKQRVGIARALAPGPEVLMMDEPLASLDTRRKAEIIPYLNRLNDELSIPILYVSHDVNEMIRLADHMVLLEAGSVQASGPTEELLTRLDLPLAYGAEAAALVNGRIIENDATAQINTIAYRGGRIFLPGKADNVGKSVRVRVRAADVSLSLEKARQTSILNIIDTQVVRVEEEDVGLVMVELDAGGTRLLSRITKHSARLLDIRPGKKVYAQVKAAALVD